MTDESTEQKAEALRVALVFRHFHPILAGAAERFRRYSEPLGRAGIGFEVFTLREEDSHPETEQMHETLIVRRLRAAGKPWVRDAALFQQAWNELSVRPARGQVLQTSLAHSLARPWLQRARRHGTGCMYVGTMVGDGADERVQGWKRMVQRWRAWRNFSPFQTVVASTTVMARWFAGNGVNAKRIEVIPNGVDVDRFRPVVEAVEKRALRSGLGLPEGGRVVIFAGSIVPRKGVDLLLQSWRRVAAQHPDARLVLVGGFARPTFMTQERMQQLTEFQNAMRAMAEAPGVAGTVIFAGESDRVQDWLRAADVFAFPSEQEGMGNVVLEAMACGLPSVITEFQGMPEKEFGAAGREFHLVPRTEEALGETLNEVLAADQRAAEMGRAARNWACEHLDVRLTLERYTKLYRRLAQVG